MATYTATPQDDSNLDVTVTEGEVTEINIQPAAVNVTGAVDSINGLTGTVTLTTSELTEGSNLYYTDARVNTLLGTKGYATEVYVDASAAATLASANTYTDEQVALINGFSGDYNDLTNKPDLFSGDYNDLTNTPTIPTNNNQLTNGAGYITDYTVTESDVTAHQAALSITESQISDLAHYNNFDADFAAKGAADLSYDNTNSSLSATTVKGAIDELDLEKANIADLAASVRLYSTDTVDATGYYQSVTSIDDARYNSTAVNISTGTISASDQNVGAVISDAGIIIGNPGNINVSTVGNVRKTSGGTGHKSAFYFTIIHRTAAGVETVMGTSSNTIDEENSNYQEFFADCLLTNPQTFTETDRIVVKYYTANVSGSPVYEFQFGGDAPVRTNLPVQVSLVAANQDASEVETDTTNFSGLLSSANTTVQSALDTLDNVSIPTQYTDADAVSALEANADTTFSGNLTVEGDFVVLEQVKLNNFEFPYIEQGQTSTWTNGTKDIDMANAYNNITLDSDSPTVTFNTDNYFDDANNLRMVHFQIDYRSGDGDINWPSNVIWEGGYTPNFGKTAYDRTIVKMIGRGSGFAAHVEQTFNPVPNNPFGSTTTRLQNHVLSNIRNVSETAATDGQVLTWNNTNSEWEPADASGGGGASAIGDLTDVNITSVADGDLLRYNGTASEWQNTNLGLTVTPTYSLAGSYFANISIEVTITNWATYDDADIWAQVVDSSDTVVVANSAITNNGDGTFSFTGPSAGTGYKLQVKVQDFGDLASEVSEQTFNTTTPSFRYVRLRIDGASSYNMIDEFYIYTGAGQTGTQLPAQMSSNTTPSPYVVTYSRQQSGYEAWEAFNRSTGLGNAWWHLGGDYTNQYLQIDLGSAQTMGSFFISCPSVSYRNGTQYTIQGSSTGAFTGEEVQLGTASMLGALDINVG